MDPPKIPATSPGTVNPSLALIGTRPVIFPDGEILTPFYRGEMLKPGNDLNGPAIVARKDTTILLGPSDRAAVDSFSNLLVTIGD
jgi:N-methylhydantoinase A